MTPPVKSPQTFSKHERLSSTKLITALFKNGKSMVVAPFRMLYMQAALSSPSPVQVAFSVPTKLWPLAVDRNRIKRQMREVYRKNKQHVYNALSGKNEQYALFVIYNSKVKPVTADFDVKLIKLMSEWSGTIAAKNE